MIALLPLFLACQPAPIEGEAVPLGERYQLNIPSNAVICEEGTPGMLWLYEGACPGEKSPNSTGLGLALGAVRYPWSLHLRITTDPPDLDCRAWPDLIGRRSIAWSCHSELDGGNGPPEHVYEGWMKLEDGQHLRFSFSEQGGNPHGVPWSVLASVRPR